MPTESEYQNARETLKTYIDAIGDVVEQEVEGIKTDKGKDVEGYNCKHGEKYYLVLSNSERRYFEIVYYHDVLEEIADIFDEAQARELIDPEDAELDLKTAAARKWVNSINREDMDQLLYYLYQETVSTDTSTAVHRTEQGGLDSFQVSRKIFPYEDTFSLSKFNHSVQAVVSMGNQGSNFLSISFSANQGEDNVEQESGVVLDLSAINE